MNQPLNPPKTSQDWLNVLLTLFATNVESLSDQDLQELYRVVRQAQLQREGKFYLERAG